MTEQAQGAVNWKQPADPAVERCVARNYPHDHVLCCDNPRCVRDADHGGHCRDADRILTILGATVSAEQEGK